MKKILLAVCLLLLNACSKNDTNDQIDSGINPSSVTDIDGNIYQTATITERPVNSIMAYSSSIGQQVWTLQNLNVSRYRNGDIIPQVQDPNEWVLSTTGAWCYYQNSTVNGIVYGKLYNWYAVNDSRGLPPLGWHIPSVSEYETLTSFLGGSEVAGGKMMALTLWSGPDNPATNSSGFTGLPGGYRDFNGQFYSYAATVGYWWTSTGYDPIYAYYIALSGYPSTYTNSTFRGFGASVRCVKN